MSDAILSRAERIERAKRIAPQNTMQVREGLETGDFITVNADMQKLLEEDLAAQRTEITKLQTTQDKLQAQCLAWSSACRSATELSQERASEIEEQTK